MDRLKNKAIIVTGAARGMGRAIALRCAEDGGDIVVCDLDFAGASNVAAEVKQLGRRALAVKVDVSQKEQVNAMVQRTLEELGRIDVLVNNAGVASKVSFLDMPEEEWDRLFAIHAKGTFLCCQAVLRYMVANGIAGSIINTSSIAAYIVFTGSAHYCASKAAVAHLSKALALEFGPHGIRVNAIAPGTFDTQMNAFIMNDPRAKAAALQTIPLGRFGMPDDAAHAVVFLASDEGSYINGAVLLIDGGQITHI